VLVAPSPQVIVAVKSLAGANGLASVNWNEALPGLTPSTPPVSVSAPGVSEASPTMAVDVAVEELEELTLSVIFTVVVYVPSSM
jgi:hypothetical protein